MSFTFGYNLNNKLSLVNVAWKLLIIFQKKNTLKYI